MEEDLKLSKQKVDNFLKLWNNTDMDIDNSFRNKVIFLTGGTGFVGTTLIKHLYEYNCKIYCIVRDGKDGTSAKERLDNILKILDIKENVYLIKGDYYKPQMGISDEDWDMLCKKVDIIFHLGCRTSFTMDYDKSRFSMIMPTLTMLELSLLDHKKLMIYGGSCISKLANKYEGMYGLHKGYCCGKYVVHNLLNYFNEKSGNIKIMYMGYTQSLESDGYYGYKDSLEEIMFLALKTNNFPRFDMYIDYADMNEICKKLLKRKIDEIPSSIGVHCREPIHWSTLYEPMLKVNPKLKKVEKEIFFEGLSEIYEKYPLLSYMGEGKKEGVMTYDFEDQMNRLFAKETIPENNMEISTPDINFFEKLFEELNEYFETS